MAETFLGKTPATQKSVKEQGSSWDGYAVSDVKELTVKTNYIIKHPLSLKCFRTFCSNPNH